jgi:ferritin-like metal-binding protein YciE
MDTLAKRLDAIIEDTTLSVRAFEAIVGVTNGSFQKVLKNGSDTLTENIRKIFLAYPEYSIDWLITGRGSMYWTDTVPKDKKEAINKIEKEIQETQERLDKLNETLEKLK